MGLQITDSAVAVRPRSPMYPFLYSAALELRDRPKHAAAFGLTEGGHFRDRRISGTSFTRVATAFNVKVLNSAVCVVSLSISRSPRRKPQVDGNESPVVNTYQLLIPWGELRLL